jgi:regulator of replication initiation timing
LTKENEKHSSDAQVLRSENKQLKKKLSDVEVQLSNLQSDYDRLLESYNAMAIECSELRRENEKLTKQINEFQVDRSAAVSIDTRRRYK